MTKKGIGFFKGKTPFLFAVIKVLGLKSREWKHFGYSF